MSLAPTNFKSKFIVHVRITAKEGKADELEAALSRVRDSSNSDKEPGTLTFRVARFGNEFLLFECYLNRQALDHHTKTEAFANLSEVGPECRVADPTVLFYEEIPEHSATPKL